MANITAVTLTGDTITLNEAVLAEFAGNLRGRLLQVGDVDYDEARVVWNGMIDKRPALIVRCTGTADVIQAVQFAQAHQLLVSVRGGGHNAAGNATCDGGVMIDLSLMRGVQIDPRARIARVQGGATWGDLDHETQAFALATPGGVVSTTGVAGLTLGGGYGWLRRKYGLSCDNLLSVDIVTADGQLLTASETENADLFWGIRGGGGNFGIVTSFEFQLYPVGPQVMVAYVFYPISEAKPVLCGWRDFMAAAPDEISSNAALWSIPPAPDFPLAMHGQPIVAVITIHSGSPKYGEKAVQPLRELTPPLIDASGIMPYTMLQASADLLFPKGQLRYYWKSLTLNHLNDDAINTLIDHAAKRPSPMTLIDLWAMGGAVSRVEAQETALGDRSAPFTLVLNTSWLDPQDTEVNIAWARNLWSAMHRFSSGNMYLNFPGLDEDGEQMVRSSYGQNYERLVALKNKYDPMNLFRLNQNIKPSLNRLSH